MSQKDNERGPSTKPEQMSREAEDCQPAGNDEEERPGKRQAGTHNLTRQPAASQVYTASAATIFETKKIATKQALSPEWVYGMNGVVPVISLQDHDELVVVYAAAHLGVIYNHTSNSQHLLQGHHSCISCLCVSEERRWIATADKGQNCMVMIWDSYSGIPVCTLFDSHPEGGVIAMAFSGDAKHLVTLGAGEIQFVCIWDWTHETEKPLWFTKLSPQHGFQNSIIFNPNDSTQLLSHNKQHVLFYSRIEENLEYFSSVLDEAVGSFSQSAFHMKHPQALTATARGEMLVWEMSYVMGHNGACQSLARKSSQTIKLHNDPITALTVTESFIITGDALGHITFYDENFRCLISYTESNLDAIASISMSKDCTKEYLEDCILSDRPFIIRDFVVTTVSFTVVHVKMPSRSPQILFNKHCEPLHALACHPKQTVVATGSHSGSLKMWDYNSKLIVSSTVFKSESKIQCLTFDPQGLYLAVGFDSGAVCILNPDTLQSDPEECFHCTQDSIQHITFSADSKYLATADAGKAVTVFYLEPNDTSVPRWKYLGRHRSHYKSIKDLIFGVQSQSRLLSLGMDRRLVEYDLDNSDENQLLILNSEHIEQSAVPTCMTWYPSPTREEFLLTASDQYKMKILNSTTKKCRRTLLGPTYGSPIKNIMVLPVSKENERHSFYLAYITEDKVGLQILPLDGNPYKSTALICHPRGVSALACSYDGQFVFTAGVADCTVLSWKINLNALEAAAALGGNDMVPFYNFIGGRDGQFYKAIEDFFYYCQVCQKLDSMETHQVSTTIPLTAIPFLMRALGFFPTEQELEDMQNEVKFSKYAETGEYMADINLEEFIKLYINHRPAFSLSTDDIIQSFSVLGSHHCTAQPVLQIDELLELLQVQGEPMTEDEVAECFTTLLGLSENNKDFSEHDTATLCNGESEHSLECVIPDQISMETFTGHILGFPSFAELSSSSSPQE
ncbi:cilia- and flagella-associated protein 251 [Thalassophryne amazonica]|uniref:cilia- and flagella-associated protein 251 n=1 Tax=Thalassophryne amazonica TaxID=390379 RepID=UPI00147172C4|nr:cilia- and flagella-associated protein 251 [Thalassophryne amazonica]